ncbi:MAG TPA: RNA polymerase sigma factor [Micromonosporaceae bacterium]
MTTTDLTKKSLAVRFHRGDETAMTELYHTYARRIFATAMQLLGHHHLAAETVQRTFIRAWQSATSYDPDRDLGPWLYAIARRAAVDVHRGQRSHRDLPLEAAQRSACPDHADPLERVWQTDQVHAALSRLSAGQRRVVRLAYFEGLSQAEIAAVEGVPIGTVKSRTARAQRRLADFLDHLN